MASRYPERAEFDVVHVGSVCRDVDPSDPRGWRLGGGVGFAALTTARLGLRSAAVVGADEAAASASELELLRSAGVELRMVPLEQGAIFENLETAHGRVQTCVEPGQPLPVVELPESWSSARAWMVVPVSNETRAPWAAAIPPAARMALGWQGLLRTLVAGEHTGRKPPTPGPLVGRADVLGVSRADLEPETSLADLNRVVRHGARVVLTHGTDGGLVFEATAAGPVGEITYAALPARQVDPTGAGDVFLAALIAAWISRGAPRSEPGPTSNDLRWAAGASALVVEGVGLAAVPDRASLLARLAVGG